MKKILFLGGADIQVTAIKKAVEMGYYVITCGYRPNNPGHRFSHEYHNISTTDKEAVLDLAVKLNVDGILAYASDPAAPTAAYVAEKLGLPTNPYRVVEIMSRKDLFRSFLKENGFKTPDSQSCDTYKNALDFVNSQNSDVIIKPVDSSGSKGVFRVQKGQDFNELFHNSMSFSRAGLVIAETFIEKKGFQIGGDGFIVDGKLVFRCFGDIHFSLTNPLLPCSVSVPTLHGQEVVERVHNEVQRLLTEIGMKMGAVNFDIIVSNSGEVFILEIGPRNGGNMIPELTEYCTGVDMKVYSIRQAMGEDCSDLKLTYEKPYFSHYVIHSLETGIVQSINKSDMLKKHILHEHLNIKPGDKVNKYESSAHRLGILLLQYHSKEEMLEIIENMKEHLVIKVA